MANPSRPPAGTDPKQDAWLTAFFVENHIDPFAYPYKVATLEQVEFMVVPEGEDRFYPCSDEMFSAIMSQKRGRFINTRYKTVFQKFTALVDDVIDSEYDRQFLKALLKIKFDHETESRLIIPSRLEKRLYTVFLSHTHIEDPHSERKRAKNIRAGRLFASETFRKALNHINGAITDMDTLSLSQLRERIKEIEFLRLLSILSATHLWNDPKFRVPSLPAVKGMFDEKISGNGLAPLIRLLHMPKSKILWLTDESGDVVADIQIARFLADLGHVVILAVKESPFFGKVSLTDTLTDPTLVKALQGAQFIHEKSISKNRLVQRLKQDENLFVISDGTREPLNLLLVSVTFSRVFKEVDCVVSRGRDQKCRLIDTHFRFTRDIINITREDRGLSITYKPSHPSFINFSHKDLEEKAQRIIDQMAAAKTRNMTVMFYSGIIGSIPGKIDVAKRIMSRFIEYLIAQSDNLFVINPSLYYEPGMDADDLMYMWEIVQRSGYIDIWRFQTADDIAESFTLMNLKVPPEWIGKDATYSTGCTKEMRIAQEVLKDNPEMQLIGPALEKFMRRDEYGVGSMYDRRLAET